MQIYISIANMDLLDQNPNPVDPNSNHVDPTVLNCCMLFFLQLVLFLFFKYICINYLHVFLFAIFINYCFLLIVR